jgi:hypothetical protein
METEDRKSQIPGELDCLGIELDKLEKTMHMLTERLQPVMRSEPEAESTPKGEANLVDLANCIRDNARRVSSMADNITSILGLLEL